MNTHAANSSFPNSIGMLMQGFQAPHASVPKNTPKVYRYPFMDRSCIRTTIHNAKMFAQNYNLEQDEKSSSILFINRELRKAIKKNPHTTIQKVEHKEFIQDNNLVNADPTTYNHAMLTYNRENGTNFLMRRFPKLRNEIAITLGHLVIFYAAQMRDGNARRLHSGVTTTQTLPRLRTNSESLRRYKVEGVEQTPFKNDAILKHIHTMVDCGILINYKSHGSNGGFSLEFNPEILAVSEVENGKIQNADNLLFSLKEKEEERHSGLVTRTLLNDTEIKGDMTSKIRGNVAIAPALLNKNNKNHRNTGKNTKSERTVGKKANQGAEILGEKLQTGAEVVPISPSSAAMEGKIKETWPLCQELEAEMHTNHIPTSFSSLEQEANSGTMSQQMFRSFLFQEFMKYISRLKKGNQSAAGAFYRAFEELEDKKMVTFTGRFFTKTAMLDEFKKWLWMVDHAERWSNKNPHFNLLYINDYLDTQRRDAKEVGFWYLEKQFNANEKKKADRKAKRTKARAEHVKRKTKIKTDRVEKFGYRSVKKSPKKTDFQKAQVAVRKYLKKEISFDDLYRYCQYNLNQNIVEGLQNLIESERGPKRNFNA